MRFIAFLLILLGCAPETGGTINGQSPTVVKARVEAFDPAKATLKGSEYVKALYGTKSPNGPICMPEAVANGYTQCSYTYTETDGTLKAGTILCSSTGCMDGEAAVTVASTDMPAQATGSSGIDNEWLMWYLLFSNGGTSSHYHTWYSSTPDYGRGAYYASGYTPSTASKSYYTSTYKAPVTSASSSKITTKTTYTSATTSTKSPSATSSSTSGTSTKATSASTKRSSGVGTSSRSSGVRSSGSRGRR